MLSSWAVVAVLLAIGAIMGIVLWFKVESLEDQVAYCEMRIDMRRDEIDALRDAHLAKVKEFTSSLKSQHTINDIFIQLLRDKTFVVVDEAPRRVARRKTKRRKR